MSGYDKPPRPYQVFAKKSGDTFSGPVVFEDKVEVFTGQGGGWRDMIGQAISPTTGAGIPLWTQMGSGPFYGFQFQLNDKLWFYYHLQHDYNPASDIYLHAHWTSDGTNVNTVKWQFTWSYAKGYNQAAFDTTGTTTSITTAGAGVAYRHMISEIATPISSANFEVDGIILTELKRVTNGGTDNTDKIWLIMADCHYQSDTFNTKNKNYPFYT